MHQIFESNEALHYARTSLSSLVVDSLSAESIWGACVVVKWKDIVAYVRSNVMKEHERPATIYI